MGEAALSRELVQAADANGNWAELVLRARERQPESKSKWVLSRGRRVKSSGRDAQADRIGSGSHVGQAGDHENEVRSPTGTAVLVVVTRPS